MIINLFIDEDSEFGDYFEHTLIMDVVPNVGDVIAFDGILYTVTHREFYVKERRTEVDEKSEVVNNVYLREGAQ